MTLTPIAGDTITAAPIKERRGRDAIMEQGGRFSYDHATGQRTVKLFSGDYYVSNEPNDLLVTILGSCVAACIRDPITKIGGMNHFLLPGSELSASHAGQATRYGIYAMEMLINDILKRGGSRERLVAKVFGGGNVLKNSVRIGSKNAEFIRNYLAAESIPLLSEDLEGELPRRVHFTPFTGKVMMRKLQRKEDMNVVYEEMNYSQKLINQPTDDGIELF